MWSHSPETVHIAAEVPPELLEAVQELVDLDPGLRPLATQLRESPRLFPLPCSRFPDSEYDKRIFYENQQILRKYTRFLIYRPTFGPGPGQN